MTRRQSIFFALATCAVITSSCDKSGSGEAPQAAVLAGASHDELASSIARDLADGNYEQASRSAEKAIAANPKDAELYLLLARAEARLQNIGKAVRALETSFEAGFHDPRGALDHPDFDTIRSSGIFADFASRFSRTQREGAVRPVRPTVSSISAGDVSIIEGSDGHSRIRAGDIVIED